MVVYVELTRRTCRSRIGKQIEAGAQEVIGEARGK